MTVVRGILVNKRARVSVKKGVERNISLSFCCTKGKYKFLVRRYLDRGGEYLTSQLLGGTAEIPARK